MKKTTFNSNDEYIPSRFDYEGMLKIFDFPYDEDEEYFFYNENVMSSSYCEDDYFDY